MTDNPRYTRKSDIIGAMRPFQREAAKLIIADVLGKKPPASVQIALDRYRGNLGLGPGYLIDDGNGWRDDIRDTSIRCLLRNGFAKGKTVKLGSNTGSLKNWVRDEIMLEFAAAIEIRCGGNLRQASIWKEMCSDSETTGQGSQAVYVYTDSLLDMLDYICCKIGRHDSSDLGAVANRVLSQYGTGHAGLPILRYVIRTDDSAALETALHGHFSKFRRTGKEAIGTEWFKVDSKQVFDQALKFLPQDGGF